MYGRWRILPTTFFVLDVDSYLKLSFRTQQKDSSYSWPYHNVYRMELHLLRIVPHGQKKGSLMDGFNREAGGIIVKHYLTRKNIHI